MNSVYLERYAWPHHLFEHYEPRENIELIIVLPAFKETSIELALQSLNNCVEPDCSVLILIVVNEPENASKEVSRINESCLETVKKYRSKFDLIATYQKLPKKKAGVGLARKIGMDEAVRIFKKSGNDGAIVCYDADCRCDENYLVEIHKSFSQTETKAGIIFYEHQLHGENHNEILNYELYLRYYIDALRYAGYPYAHQTLGSCIAVRSSHYEKVGGMNSRQAGEDFYFLNKTIPMGGFVEINSTTVRPSDRISDRVPFGTGKAVKEIQELDEYEVYHPNTFEDLKLFFDRIEIFWLKETWKIPMTVKTFLGDDWEDQIEEIKTSVNSYEGFQKRFFHWFDAFQILKYVHFTRDNFYQNVTLEEALEWLRNHSLLLKGSISSQLIQLRYHDRKYVQLDLKKSLKIKSNQTSY